MKLLNTIGFKSPSLSYSVTLMLSMLAPSYAAYAQAPPLLPPTRDELDPVARNAQAQTETRISVDGDIERAPCPLADPAYADVKITLNEVHFNNLKGLSEAELRPTYAAYLGLEQPIGVLCDIRDAAAMALRTKGYLAAVQVPAQRIEGGVVNFEMLYARMTALRVRGATGGATKLIEHYLGQLTKDEIFDRNRAERYLLLARDLPGYDVRLTLRPAGTGLGELVGEVTVIRTPVEVDFTVQNLAARDTGPWGGQVRAAFNGLTGQGDRTTVSFYSTSDFREQQILQLGHEMRVGHEGLTLSGQFTYAWTKPDINAAANTPDLTARTLLATGEISYPLIRTTGKTVRLTGGIDFLNQHVNFITRLSEDRLRIGFARVDFEAIDARRLVIPRWRLAGALELRQGFALFGASQGCAAGCGFGVTPPSRADGNPKSTVLRFAGEGEVLLSKSLSVNIQTRLQYGFTPLFSFEEFSGGNYTIGRGYDPATVIGDSGAAARFELRGPRLGITSSRKLVVQPYGFGDAAWAWDRNVPTNSTNRNPQRLISVGGGIRADLSNRFRLDLSVAVPTERAGLQIKRGGPRVLLSLTTRLLPWRK